MNLVEMPDRMTQNLIRSIRLNEGKLGRKRQEGEFEKLTDDEVVSIETIVQRLPRTLRNSDLRLLSRQGWPEKCEEVQKELGCESSFHRWAIS